MNEIENKVLTGQYKSHQRALAAIQRSKLSKSDKARLTDLAGTTYRKKADQLTETTDVGKDLMVPLGPSTSPPKMDLEKELMRMALRAHYIMGVHKLSREEFFDSLKEVMLP